MSNDNLFYQFAVLRPQDPIQHIKNLLTKAQKDLSSAPNELIRIRNQKKISDFQDFLNFIGSESENTIDILEKTNEDEKNPGVVPIAIALLKRPYTLLDEVGKNKLLPTLYKSDDSRSKIVFFEQTKLRSVYLWWEKGEVTQEAFGEGHNDTFRGFVRINS